MLNCCWWLLKIFMIYIFRSFLIQKAEKHVFLWMCHTVIQVWQRRCYWRIVQCQLYLTPQQTFQLITHATTACSYLKVRKRVQNSHVQLNYTCFWCKKYYKLISKGKQHTIQPVSEIKHIFMVVWRIVSTQSRLMGTEKCFTSRESCFCTLLSTPNSKQKPAV